MANIPRKAQRMYAINTVEKTCRSKGAFLKKDVANFEGFIEKIKKTYPVYANTINKCLESTKNILLELVHWAHVGIKVVTPVALKWFKSLLNTIVLCLKSGLRLALNFLQRYINIATQDLANTVIASPVTGILVNAITGSVIAGIVASVIILGIGLWMNSVHDICISNDYGGYEKTKQKIQKTFNMADDDVPEELAPPDPRVPALSIATFKESAGATLIGSVLFIVFLKAAITHRFNEELKEKIHIMSSLLTPSSALLGVLTTLLLFGSGGAAALV